MLAEIFMLKAEAAALSRSRAARSSRTATVVRMLTVQNSNTWSRATVASWLPAGSKND
jgi:hypothetical protein